MRFTPLLVAACLAFGCGKSDDKGTNPPPPPGPTGGPPTGGNPTPAVDLVTAKPDHVATAAEWHAECKKDKEAAKTKYAGKVIELTGTVRMVEEAFETGVLLVHLKIEKDILGVRCGVDLASGWEKVAAGTEVTIRGKLPPDAIFTGELIPATVVKVEKNPAEVVSAVDLAKRFKADMPKLKGQMKDKWLYVTGEVHSIDKVPDGVPLLILKGDGDCNVTFGVPADARRRLEALKPGQKVSVLADFNAYGDDKGPSLNQAKFR